MTFSELKEIGEMLKGQECYKKEPTNNQVKNSNNQMKNDDKKKR